MRCITKEKQGVGMSDYEPTVLIVEDVKAQQLLIQELITRVLPNALFILADTLTEALERVEDCNLVILDLGLPDTKVGCTESIQRLRGKTLVPIIVCSATFSLDLVRECIRSGANGYANKDEQLISLTAQIVQLEIQNKEMKDKRKRVKQVFQETQQGLSRILGVSPT